MDELMNVTQYPPCGIYSINIGLAKKFIWVFLYHLTDDKPEWTFWPNQYDYCDYEHERDMGTGY